MKRVKKVFVRGCGCTMYKVGGSVPFISNNRNKALKAVGLGQSKSNDIEKIFAGIKIK